MSWCEQLLLLLLLLLLQRLNELGKFRCHNGGMTGQIGASGMSVIRPYCTHTPVLAGFAVVLEALNGCCTILILSELPCVLFPSSKSGDGLIDGKRDCTQNDSPHSCHIYFEMTNKCLIQLWCCLSQDS